MTEKLREQLIYDDRGLLEAKLYFNENNKLQGICEYYIHGKLHMRAAYENGALHGPATHFDPAGHVMAEKNFENGYEHGESKHYDEAGTLRRLETYQKGQLHGPFQTYHQNGELIQEGTYHEHKRVGSWNHYTHEGELAQTGYFDIDGKLIEPFDAPDD